MALKEYVGLARLTQAFSLLKSKLDGKEDTPTVISYDDFMALTPQQQTSGYYLVVGGTPMTNAYGISYQPNKTVGDALDDHADAISELNADKLDKYEQVAVSVGGKTFAQQLSELYTTWQTLSLSVERKMRAFLKINQSVYYIINIDTGLFSTCTLDASHHYITQFDFSTGKFYTSQDNSISDNSSVTNNFSMELYA